MPTDAEAVPTGNNYVRRLDRGRQLCPGFPTRSTAGAGSASRHLASSWLGQQRSSPDVSPGGAAKEASGAQAVVATTVAPRSDLAIRALLGQTEGLGRDTEREHHLLGP